MGSIPGSATRARRGCLGKGHCQPHDGPQKEFQIAVKQDPRHALAHYFTGEVYFKQKKWKDALAAYQRCANANPRDPDPQARMCLCYLALRKPSEALAALKRAPQIDPQNPMANQIAAELVK
jgi:tetratricopeptide (TPR) repeat protein